MTMIAHIQRMCLLLCLMAGLWMVPGLSHASGCDIYGGTSYKGCVLPTIKWSDGFGNVLDSKLDAEQSNYGHYMAAYPNTRYTGGLKTAPVNYSRWGTACASTQYTESSALNTSSTYVAGGSVDNLYENVLIYGFELTADTCGNYYKLFVVNTGYSVSPLHVCPPSYVFENYSGNSRTAPFGWACKPATPDSESDYNKPCACNGDFDVQGTGEAGDPFTLADRHLREYALDLKTGGPFPIVWDRRYAPEGYRGGVFQARQDWFTHQPSPRAPPITSLSGARMAHGSCIVLRT
jgi:hypothetical protein